MTLAAAGLFIIPRSTEGEALNTRSFLINGSTEKVGYVLHAPVAGVITGVGFRIGTITTTDDLDVSLYSVTTDGEPNAVLTESAANVTTNLAVPATGINNVVFDQSYTAAKGERIAVVVEFGTYGAGDITLLSATEIRSMFPLVYHDTGSGWVGDIDSGSSVFLNYGDTYYQQFEAGYRTETSFSTSGAQTVEQGFKFQVAAPCRLVGVSGDFRTNGVSDAITFDFYTSAQTPTNGTRLLSTTAGLWGAGNNLHSHYMFTTPQTLAANTTYRLTFDSAGTISMPVLTYDSAAHMDTAKGAELMHFTKDNGASDWTDEPTKLPHFSMIIDQIDDGAGGGGGLITHPGMSGGTNG